MTGTPSERLVELGLTLPAVVPPLATYVPAVWSGDHVFTAGQLPLQDGSLMATGKVGIEVSVDVGYACARQAALNAVAAAASVAGGIDRIAQIVKVVVFVAGGPEFTAQPGVANGASDVLAEIFGDQGRHVRSAVGVAALPLDAPVEVELVARVA